MLNLKSTGLLFLSLIIIGSVLISACDTTLNTESETDKTLENLYTITSVNDVSLKAKVSSWHETQLGPKKEFKISSESKPIEFDFSKLKIAQKKGESRRSIVAYQNDYDKENLVNYGIGFVENKNKEIKNALIVRLEKISDDLREVSYYDLKGNLKVTIRLNKASESTTVVYPDRNIKNNNFKFSDPGCDGEEVAQCVANTYSKEGWKSVATFVATAFYPVVALAVTADCTEHSCTDDGYKHDGTDEE